MIFFTSDTHFFHGNIIRYCNRPFDSIDAMNEGMIQRWNNRVGPEDTVYHLGDVVINRRALKTLARLNGDKVLIKGNHDIFRLEEYTPHFRDIRGYHVMNGMILSHIPLHPESLGRFGVNIHGHLHANRVMRYKTIKGGVMPNIPLELEIDVRYHCVCVEQTPDFAPILFEDVIKRIEAEGGVVGFRNGNGPTM